MQLLIKYTNKYMIKKRKSAYKYTKRNKLNYLNTTPQKTLNFAVEKSCKNYHWQFELAK